MDLRVTPQVVMDRAIRFARQHSDLLAQFQEEAATGSRLLHPSDDPLATVSVMDNKAQVERLDTYLGNIQQARTDLNISNSAMLEAGNVLSNARSIAIEASNSGNDSSAFEALAEEIDSDLSRIIDLANTQNGGRYVFSGTSSNVPPFRIAGTDSQGRPASVVYDGALDRGSVTVSQRQRVATLYAGSEIFQQRTRQTTVFTGDTGVAAGTGTDSGTGEGTLIIGRVPTTYAAGSGVAAGSSSATGDTIVGPPGANTLTIAATGTSGTVALNGGPAIAFTNADTNLQVTGPNGESVFVDLSGITPNFNGSVALTPNLTLSTDGGATTVPVDFTSTNQVVTNSQTGAVTNINSTGIRRTGTAGISYTGTADAFQALIALRDDLRNTRGLSSTQQIQSIAARIGDLDRVRGGILQIVGEQSASLQNLDGLENRIKDVQLDTQKLTTDLEGADISKVVIGMTEQQNLLQLTLASTARLSQLSLLDFLK